MYMDAVDLRDFYASGLGQVARRMIQRRLRALWPNVRGETVLGLGYATPYLRAFRNEAQRVIAVMPAQQGVLHWPPEGPNLVSLADEVELPLPDLSVDRVLLAHGLECTEQLRALLREVWRVLTGHGRLLIIVPNRRGIWARREATPFGAGQPYTPGQLSRLLRDNLFTPLNTARALYLPPLDRRLLIRSAPAFENLGQRWFQVFAGVVMVEAGKRLYAATAVPAKPRRRVLVGLPKIAPPGARRSGR
ncbi:MAG: class I SAM-dependent methyltransferase [Kiloniellales bacterium]